MLGSAGWRSFCAMSGVVGLVALLGLVVPSIAAGQAHRSPPQVVPQSLDRVFATQNSKLDIDGLDDQRVDVDIAILDTGVQLDHPDLNIVARTDCTNATWPYSGPDFECTDASPDDGDEDVPGINHGTGSATAAAGLDNGIGRVGIAAGARLWAVDISGPERYGAVPSPDPLPNPTFNLEYLIAGVRWVTAHADEIEVVHMAALCIPQASLPPNTTWPPCGGTTDVDLVAEFEDAIADSLAAGVFYVTGSREYHMDTFVPGRLPNMFFATQVADSDGLPGGLGPATCRGALDDHSVGNSGWGVGADIASIGCAGSGSAPHVTAAAAVLASRKNPNSLADVQEIGQTIAAAGNDGWTDDSPDGIKEPLLDVGDEGVFDPVTVPGEAPSRFANSTSWTFWGPSYSFDIADVNGDAQADIIGRNADGDVQVGLSTGTDFSTSTSWTQPWGWSPSYSLRLADVNGDNQADTIGTHPGGDVQVGLSTGTNFASSNSWTSWSSSYSFDLADVNGDDLADIVGRNADGDVQVRLSTGTSFANSSSWTPWSTAYTLQLVDVNGDDLADIVGRNAGGDVQVGLSTGTSFANSTSWTFWGSSYSFDIADVNGDTRADIIGRNASGDVQVGLSTGTDFSTSTSWTQPWGWSHNYSLQLADVNGDNQADIIGRNTGGDVQVGLSSN